MNPKLYECDKCKENIGIIGKWLFWGLLHRCKTSYWKDFHCRECRLNHIRRNGISDLWDYPLCEICQENIYGKITRSNLG